MAKDKNTELLILESAGKIFIEKGYYGARMQEIADTAGINKALLHYYFRSKDKLFKKIFDEAATRFLPEIQEIMNSDREFWEKIKLFIESYINLINENQFLPLFILKEVARNPDTLENLLNNKINLIYSLFQKAIEEQIELKKIKLVDPKQLILNLTSLCIFPFVGKPILKILIHSTDDEYKALIEERKEIIFEVLYQWLHK